MIVENRVDTFDVPVRQMMQSFKEKIYSSENKFMECIVKNVAWE